MSAVPAPARRSAFADRLLEFPDFVFSDGREFSKRGAWRDYFASRMSAESGEPASPTRPHQLIFEIGCNDAALLARVAAKHPATAFIGIDWKYRALHAAAERVAAAGLRNVALLHGRGQDVSKIFADGEVDEVWVFHPDPCDKPRELPNRLIGEPFLLDVHRVLRDGRSLILKTDHPGYYQWVLGLLGLPEPEAFAAARRGDPPAAGRSRVRVKGLMPPADVPAASAAVLERFRVEVASADLWNDPAAQAATAGRCFAGEATSFETRFRGKRWGIYYMEIEKRSADRPAQR